MQQVVDLSQELFRSVRLGNKATVVKSRHASASHGRT